MNETGCLENYTGPLLLGKIHSSNLLLLNVFYHRPVKEYQYKDYASILVKDVGTGEKKIITIEDPMMLMYIVKPEYRNYNYVPAYRPLSMCDVRKVKYKNIVKEIVKEGGEELKNYYDELIVSGFGARRNIHKYPYVLGTDYDYPSYFRCEWALHYHNQDIRKDVTKSYLDIEVDSIDIEGFPRPGSCPINAVTYVDGENKVSYTFLLRNIENPLIDDFERNMSSFLERCHQSFDESYPGFEYRILMYDDELDLIQGLFDTINNLKLDFAMYWSSFDIEFIIARLKRLGKNPSDVMCNHDFVRDELSFKKDTMHYEFKRKNDVFICTSYTVFIDQMTQYIKIRKQQKELKSIKLNMIAMKELQDSKLDYSDIANIKTLPYEDYELFVLYNIKDVLLLYGIENKTHDIDNILDRALTNGTNYSSLFSQTIMLKNRAYISYFKQGYIIGNNRNIDYSVDREEQDEDDDDKKDKFTGALVADPDLNDYIGTKIFGKPSKWVFRNVVDFDMNSMYPFITCAHNIGHETMIGKIILNGFEHLDIDPTERLYDGGKMFIEALLSKDYNYIGSIYFNLPKAEDIIGDLERIKTDGKDSIFKKAV